MEIKIAIWSNGDDSVGINGVNHTATIKIEPEIDFSVMDDNAEEECRKLLEEGAVEMIKKIEDFIDCDCKVHIVPERVLIQEAKDEGQFEI